ncbi:DEAD/DEAH box helicase [Microbacterium sp. SSW1-49]|uniref:DEAD/DEAH box helicase n=1 Tax=Microbacterium croceum TaxID=2851645 RepID=A0ABT0FCT4_9MICO|nr:DEAD/DEAH box helicase [Microbacterium croceum]MCK2035489.1 DEAD/DEAH box helicase [Microbacterium croceum]
MPKSKKPQGGRPARNFEPRYGANKTSFHDRHHGAPARDGARPERGGRSDAGERRSAPAAGGYDRRPGSRSAGHRGYRPAEAEGGAPKQRWSAQERAGRDEARSIRNRAESGRRDAPHHRDERPRTGGGSYDRGAQRPTGPGTYRDDRGGQRFGRDERPSSGGDQRRGFRDGDHRSGDSARRDDRGGQRFDRDARPRRDDRGAQARGYGDRPNRGAERSDRSFDADRARRSFDRDRTQRSFDGGRDERPRTGERSRPATGGAYRTERVRPLTSDTRGRPARNERPSRNDWNAAPSAPSRGVKFEQTEDVVHERLEAKSVQAVEVADVTFGDLGLGSNIVETLAGLGAAKPFAIQAASIPAVLEGRDVLARGRTGSGKTIAFGAPLVERVLQSQAGKRREFGRSPRAIILAPTRELALQIDRTIQPIARSVGLFTTQIYGGVPQGRQVGALKKGVDIVIGTPGRIEDLINQGKLDLSDCRIAVLDEADHMCELGFVEPVQRILRHTADGSQKLLFSATLDREVAALVDEFLVDPAVFEVAGEDQGSSTIEHRVLVIEHRDKADILTSLVDREGKTLVFARTRAYADMLAEQFDDAGIPAVSLHGDLNQAKRTRNLERLTSGRVNVLVATDVAARGIHVDDIDLVVQADAPDEYKTYLHRSGRTGRAGRMGRVVTLITRQRQRRMTELLDRAEIDAPFENARVNDDIIEEITGRVPTAAQLTS